LTDGTKNTLQKLVELIAALQTSQSTLERAKAYAVACGKGNHPITAFIAPNG
jgi:3-hydroxyacyl-CoA dehydrogenase